MKSWRKLLDYVHFKSVVSPVLSVANQYSVCKSKEEFQMHVAARHVCIHLVE